MGFWHAIVCTGCSLVMGMAAPASTDSAQAAAVADIRVPFRDARDVGPSSVRFSAAQLTRDAPTVVLFGATTPSWHKARAAIQQAIYEGHPVTGVFMGPTSEPPALEIYAHGQLVTRPIDLDKIQQWEITRLLRDVWREYYAQ